MTKPRVVSVPTMPWLTFTYGAPSPGADLADAHEVIDPPGVFLDEDPVDRRARLHVEGRQIHKRR